MKKKLISLLLLAAMLLTLVPQTAFAATHYSKLYFDFITRDRTEKSYIDDWQFDWVTYRLPDLNGDSIPELWIDYAIGAEGCQIATVYNGKVYSYTVEYGTLYYNEGKNAFALHFGHQGIYEVVIYTLDRGNMLTLAAGTSNSDTGVCTWNGATVSPSTYARNIQAYIDPDTQKSTADEDQPFFSYNEILSYMDVLYANNASPFTDVSPDRFYYDPVLWAVNSGITNGTAPDRFSPEANCTRGQIVTFLWRAMGQPEPSAAKSPFTDVKTGSYCDKAIRWAVEKGITTGMTASTFAPDSPCTRGQAVTFLWRAMGQPKPSGSGTFSDVKAGSFYSDAVRWAVKNAVTNGTDATHFSPDQNCTRGQIVTFLYRCMG